MKIRVPLRLFEVKHTSKNEERTEPSVEYTQEELLAKLDTLRNLMIMDHNKKGDPNQYDIHFEFGKKYIRVVMTHYGSPSCAGFVCCDRNHKKFQFGDLLKSDTWSAPAMNKARGSVFALEGKRVLWTGI